MIKPFCINSLWCAKKQKFGIGVARYYRFKEEPDVAEFAITVHDKFQNQGIDTILFDFLRQSAMANGIKVLRGYVLAENTPMLALCNKYNCKITKEKGTLLQADIRVLSE